MHDGQGAGEPCWGTCAMISASTAATIGSEAVACTFLRCSAPRRRQCARTAAPARSCPPTYADGTGAISAYQRRSQWEEPSIRKDEACEPRSRPRPRPGAVDQLSDHVQEFGACPRAPLLTGKSRKGRKAPDRILALQAVDRRLEAAYLYQANDPSCPNAREDSSADVRAASGAGRLIGRRVPARGAPTDALGPRRTRRAESPASTPRTGCAARRPRYPGNTGLASPRSGR